MNAGATQSLRHLNKYEPVISFIFAANKTDEAFNLQSRVSFFGKENWGEFSVSVFRHTPGKTAPLNDSFTCATLDLPDTGI